MSSYSLSSVCQLLYKLHTSQNTPDQQSLEALPERFRQKIFYNIWKLAGEPQEADYGKVHVFDSPPKLQRAIAKIAVEIFKGLDQDKKDLVAWKVRDYAGQPLSESNWGENHALDDIPLFLKLMIDSSKQEERKMELLVDNHHGIYIPQVFAKRYNMEAWHVDEEDAEILKAGPEHDDYWETWDSVMSSAYYLDDDGNEYCLTNGECGDLFAAKPQEAIQEEIADEYGLDFDSFVAFCENACITLDVDDTHEIKQVVQRFEDVYMGTFNDGEEWAEEFISECYGVPEVLAMYIAYKKFFNDATCSDMYELELPGGKIALFRNT